MTQIRHIACFALFAATAAFVLAGCGPGKTGKTKTVGGDPPNGGHEHGPHKGHLVELGGAEFFGEVVDDHDNEQIAVYILDSSKKKNHPIEAAEVVINVSHDGEAESFKLAAKPEDDDGEGKSSRFVLAKSSMEEDYGRLHKDLHAKSAKARLTVQISDKSYTGDIEPLHD